MPQVHGAVRDALDHLRRVLDIELNSATDNPLVFPGGGVADPATIATGGGRVISGGNFHGEPIALALDFAKLALAELGSISERRTALLVDPRLNGGLPPFLAAASGVDSGMMIYQYTAAALASENKVLAHPASVDSIPTSANQEDHVSMGSIAARHARTVLEHVERILAHRAAGRGAGPRPAAGGVAGTDARPAPGRRGGGARARSRAEVRHLDGDREPGPDLAAAAAIVHDGLLADLAEPCRVRAQRRRDAAPRLRVGRGGGSRSARSVRSISSRYGRPPAVLEPDQVPGVDPGDLADRPADVASEAEHRARRPARRRTGAAGAVVLGQTSVPGGRRRRPGSRS